MSIGYVIGYVGGDLLMAYIVLWLWGKFKKKKVTTVKNVLILGFIFLLLSLYGRSR